MSRCRRRAAQPTRSSLPVFHNLPADFARLALTCTALPIFWTHLPAFLPACAAPAPPVTACMKLRLQAGPTCCCRNPLLPVALEIYWRHLLGGFQQQASRARVQHAGREMADWRERLVQHSSNGSYRSPKVWRRKLRRAGVGFALVAGLLIDCEGPGETSGHKRGLLGQGAERESLTMCQ